MIQVYISHEGDTLKVKKIKININYKDYQFGYRIMANIAVINDCQKDPIYHKSLNTSSE